MPESLEIKIIGFRDKLRWFQCNIFLGDLQLYFYILSFLYHVSQLIKETGYITSLEGQIQGRSKSSLSFVALYYYILNSYS